MAQAACNQANSPLVLIVDDEASICSSLADVLKDEAFETICAHSGEEALPLVETRKPDIVFLDIWMPGWDGIETLDKIKETSPTTEVVMISGHATIPNALEAIKRGALDLIEKPLDIDSILLAAATALNRREKLAESVPVVESEASSAPSARVLPLGKHKGVSSKTLAGENIGQRTLKESVVLYGQCLHSGAKSGLVLEPLPLNSGIHLAKMGGATSVPAFIEHVESTTLATTVRGKGIAASTIEHLLAALHAYQISNLLIKCNGEVPIFDGSSLVFCDAIESTGLEEQGGEWIELAPQETVSFAVEGSKAGEMVSIEPADCLKVTYELAYPAPVGEQKYEYTYTGPESFRELIAPARTFGFMSDIERMQRAGLAAGGRLDNFILIGADGILNTELRFPDELARHKVLDAIGDLFLAGRPLRGHIKARMTGHSDNAALLRKIAKLAELY